MKIAGYIGDLLFEYECVVIPGLGGFLTRDHAAYIHPMKHYFKPPHREVVFNPMLRTNDGLLLNYIARSEKLAYHDAKSRLDRFVLKCLSVMDEGKKIHFRSIGSITYNKERQIVFEPDTNQNYLAESFGLSGFVSPPIKREDFQKRVEKVFANPPRRQEEEPKEVISKKPLPVVEKRMLASHRPGKLKRQLVIVGAAASLLFAAWGTMNYKTVEYYYDQYKGHASILPFFYASPNEYVIHHLDKLPAESMIPAQDFTGFVEGFSKAKAGINDLIPANSYQAEIVPEPKSEPLNVIVEQNILPDSVYTKDIPEQIETPIVTPPVEVIKEEFKEEKPAIVAAEVIKPVQSSNKKIKEYHIIAGAFKEKKNADNLIEDLKKKSFEAVYAGQTSGGLWRVSYGTFENETVALKQLEEVKRNENKQAWLLVI
jgi:hypothetical protein